MNRRAPRPILALAAFGLTGLLASSPSAQVPSDCDPVELWSTEPEPYHYFGWRLDTDGTAGIATSAGLDAPIVIWARTASGWEVDASIEPADLPESTHWGEDVEIDGLLAAISVSHTGSGVVPPDPSHVEIYRRDGTGWSLDGVVRPMSGDPLVSMPSFGWDIDLEGESLVVGSNWDDKAFVYERAGGDWVQQAVLSPSRPEPQVQFGQGVAIEGDRVAVGAPGTDDDTCPLWLDCTNAGAVEIYERSGETWERTALLRAPDSNFGAGFGWTVSLDGDRLAVGAPGARMVRDDSSTMGGAIYVFERDAATGEWSMMQRMDFGPRPTGLRPGFQVTLDGRWLSCTVSTNLPLVGGPGSVQFFELEGGTWVHRGERVEGGAEGLYAGQLAMAGDTLFVGSPGRGARVGSVFVHECPSMMSDSDLEPILEEPSPVDLRIAPPLTVNPTRSGVVLGWEETNEDPDYRLQVGTLLSLWRDRTYDHEPIAPCPIPDPEIEIPLPEGNVYFLTVAVDEETGEESSYGRDSEGRERPVSTAGCP